MSVSLVNNGSSILQQSSKLYEKAASEVQQQSSNQPLSNQNDGLVKTEQVEQTKSKTPDYTQPMVTLSQAAQYNKVGTTVMQKEQDMLGTLLDIQV